MVGLTIKLVHIPKHICMYQYIYTECNDSIVPEHSLVILHVVPPRNVIKSPYT